MKSKRFPWPLLLCGFMALALALATASCDDDDDRSSDDPAIDETSEDAGDGESDREGDGEASEDGSGSPGTGGGTPTGEDGDGEGAEEASEDDALPEDLESVRPPDLTPPGLISPANNETLFTSQSSLKITFRWNAVEGATGYRLFINDVGTLTDGTSLIKSCNIGDGQRWYVQAVWGLRAGPVSDHRSFNVRSLSGGL